VLSEADRLAIRSAFQEGKLETLSSVKGSVPTWTPISDVLQHHTGHKRAFEVTTSTGRSVVATEDHSLFTYHDGVLAEIQTSELAVGSYLAVVVDGNLESDVVVSLKEVPALELSYDLSVPGPENFTTSSGILAHNTYSIGGISLDIDKSSKYESAANVYKDLFDTQLERAKQTVKIVKGLQQPKYGMGVRSSFGPYAGRGQLTPAKFVGFVIPFALFFHSFIGIFSGMC